MFPNEILEDLRQKVSNDEYLETLFYESVRELSMTNYDEGIQYIHKAIDKKPYLLKSLKRMYDNGLYELSDKSKYLLFNEFKIPLIQLPEPPHKCFFEDDVDDFIKWCLENPDKNTYMLAFNAINWDSVNILKYLIVNNDLKFYIQDLSNSALMFGNYEIIRLFEQCGADYTQLATDETFMFCVSRCDIRNWLRVHYYDELEYFASYNILCCSEADKQTISILADLPNVFNRNHLEDNRRKRVMCSLIELRCENILTSIKEFTVDDLTLEIASYRKELFDIIFEKIANGTALCENGLNILQVSILAGANIFVEPIVKKYPEMLFVKDNLKNNILHFCARQHSIIVFRNIRSMVPEKVTEMLNEKNVFGETPIDLLKRYDQEYYLNDSYEPPNLSLEVPSSNLDDFVTIFSNHHMKTSLKNCFRGVCDSIAVKFVDTRNIECLDGLFGSFKECHYLKYWDVSNVKSMRDLFTRYKGNSLKGLENWNVSNVKCFRGAFTASKITNLNDLSKWNVRKDADFSLMFNSCDSLTDCSGIDSWEIPDSNPTKHTIFHDCPNITRYPKWY